MAKFMDRLKRSINIFRENEAATLTISPDSLRGSIGSNSSSYQRITYDSQQKVLAPIVTRLSMDAASIPLRHVVVNEFLKFESLKSSELDERLTVQANLDQQATGFRQDVFRTMLSHGSCVIVPVDYTTSPNSGDSYEILSARVGIVEEWLNKSVRVSVYNENTGQRETITVKKDFAAIVYNPLYQVMNEPNSTLSRLIDRLALLDIADGKAFSPGLDLIIQLPYVLKNDRRVDEAERRITAIESQLEDSKRGIAYIDANERVTQLNRPVTNILNETVTGLTETLYSQLGLTPPIINGTATLEEMIAYNNRTIIPLVRAVGESLTTAFFTRTAISQGHRIMPLPDLFKMAPIGQIADAADKLTRNEIMTSNEVRSAIGLPPSEDPEADSLRNKNLNKAMPPGGPPVPGLEEPLPNEEPLDEQGEIDNE